MVIGFRAASRCCITVIKLSVQPDGTFTVTNSRNGFSKTYVKRSPAVSGARRGE